MLKINLIALKRNVGFKKIVKFSFVSRLFFFSCIFFIKTNLFTFISYGNKHCSVTNNFGLHQIDTEKSVTRCRIILWYFIYYVLYIAWSLQNIYISVHISSLHLSKKSFCHFITLPFFYTIFLYVSKFRLFFKCLYVFINL